MAAYMPEEQQFLLTRQRIRDGELPFLKNEFDGVGWMKISNGETYLHMACYYRQSEVIEYLIKQAVEYNDKEEVQIWLKSLGMTENSPLHNYLCVSAMAYKTKPRCTTLRPQSCIIHALAKLGVDINSKNCYNETALFLAINRDDILSVQALIELGADVNIQCCVLEETSLHQACLRNVEMLKMLLKVPGIDINNRNNRGVTPLHLACQNGRPQPVALLLRFGADVASQSILGEMPIFYSLRPPLTTETSSTSSLVQNSETSFEIMFRHVQNPKNSINATEHFLHRNTRNESLLLSGVKYGNLTAVQTLLEKLSIFDINERTSDGKTLLHHAMLNSQDKGMIEYLLGQGIESDVQDGKGNTPLMYLFKKDRVGPQSMVRELDVMPNINV